MAKVTERHGERGWNMRLLGSCDLGGYGDGMHVNVRNGIAYVGHMGYGRDGDDLVPHRVGTSIVDVSDPHNPRLVRQLSTPPGTHSHKVQLVEDVLLINHERHPLEPDATEFSAGLAVYDVGKDPADPQLIAFMPMTGDGVHVGVHRMTYWKPPYAFASASDDGFTDQFLMVIDLSDPAHPLEAGRFWLPGMHTAAGEAPAWGDDRRFGCHHAIVSGDRAYCGWWDGGLVIVDISDISAPTLVSQLDLGPDVSGATHSALPISGRGLVVLTDESMAENCDEVFRHIRIIDVSDEKNPREISKFPVPEGDFCSVGGRFGAHNVHEPRPGSLQDQTEIYTSYYNAGVRVVDISDAYNPREVAWFIPACPPGQPAIQINDVYVHEDGLVYATDRHNGGLYIMERTDR
jgi:hypothetical protein